MIRSLLQASDSGLQASGQASGLSFRTELIQGGSFVEADRDSAGRPGCRQSADVLHLTSSWHEAFRLLLPVDHATMRSGDRHARLLINFVALQSKSNRPTRPFRGKAMLGPRTGDDAIMTQDRRNRGVLVEFQPMSPEEIDRTVQFLLRQQAQFAADFERLSGKTDLIADGLIGLTGIVGRIADAQERTDRQLKETDARLSEHIKTVESHLNVVVEMFERHLREDHGRRPS
jgi:hypothetical protein